MNHALVSASLLLAASAALAQDQQLGARTKAMGGSYTAFEDDPVSVWLNPAGIATQPTAMSISYQAYVTYPLHREKDSGSSTVTFSAGAETTFVDPAIVPSFLGFVFAVGEPESPMAIGLCYARPYHLNYSFDQVSDPFQTDFTPDTNVDESFNRFRVAFAKDFRWKPAGEPNWLTHLSVGIGLDAGYERWEMKGSVESASDNATGFGGGAGLLLGLYDDGESLRVNLGLAWQSPINWRFNIDPDIYPAFDMPQQVNCGATFYLLEGMPLRATLDFQWIEWSGTADVPAFDGKEEFQDAVNLSLGVEYRIKVSDRIAFYPRAGIRRFDAPWDDKDALPVTSDFQLVLDTKGDVFTLATFGGGISWTGEDGRLRTLDLGVDVGGDSYSFAVGFTNEF